MGEAGKTVWRGMVRDATVSIDVNEGMIRPISERGGNPRGLGSLQILLEYKACINRR